MKRYIKDPYCRCCMEPDKAGAWVLFEDIAPPAGLEDDLDAALRASQARVDRLREALRAIAFTKDVAATPLASAHTMQKLASDALASDSVIELTALSQNLNDARAAPSA